MKDSFEYYNDLLKRISELRYDDTSLITAHKIANKIVWCNKFKKITKCQCDNLCDLMVEYFDSWYN